MQTMTYRMNNEWKRWFGSRMFVYLGMEDERGMV